MGWCHLKILFLWAMKPEKLTFTWKLCDIDKNHGPPRVEWSKWKWNAYYISRWAKVTQVSDMAYGPLVFKVIFNADSILCQSNKWKIVYNSSVY
jgi:hypothetical protein